MTHNFDRFSFGDDTFYNVIVEGHFTPAIKPVRDRFGLVYVPGEPAGVEDIRIVSCMTVNQDGFEVDGAEFLQNLIECNWDVETDLIERLLDKQDRDSDED